MRDSDHYRPCVAIFPNGQTRRTNIQHIRMDTVTTAVAKLTDDRAAWVAPEEFEDVMAAWSDAKEQRKARTN